MYIGATEIGWKISQKGAKISAALMYIVGKHVTLFCRLINNYSENFAHCSKIFAVIIFDQQRRVTGFTIGDPSMSVTLSTIRSR